jgi:DNA repair protein RadA/Sms
MAKEKSQYTCDNCGAVFPRWSGQCDSCKEWNTLVEGIAPQARAASAGKRTFYGVGGDELISAREVANSTTDSQRLTTGLYELDRVFGGGIVFGSVFLVGGQPGIGKSTILTQMAINILKNHQESTIIYLAGEESPQQIGQRLQRMMAKTAETENVLERFLLSSQTNVDGLMALIEQKKPGVLIVDSIQTLFTEELSSIAGSTAQLRESAARVVAMAKKLHIPTFLVGHVTKDGDIAGPKILEHIVDSVIEINGDRNDEIRIVRSLKNRFGPTDEVGLFRLTSGGAEEVSNPAEVFLEEKSLGKPGSALALCMEGSRPVIVEVQALVVPSHLPNPRRVSRGINVNKLHLLVAVLQKHAKINLSENDVFVNVVGSLEFRDPAIDLAVAAALISSKKETSLGAEAVYCGEIGLLGEVRRVVGLEKRIKEAKRLGYKKIFSSTNTLSVKNIL